ncbi:Tetratricopeptide repeat protein 14 [Aix galericulata]|nr:Tetratricopeptide repeat protein 14 [Aix galericulata]
MERDLLRQVLNYHGPGLLALLRAEQHDNPDFRGLLPPPGTAPESPRGGAPRAQAVWSEVTGLEADIQRFIAQKADLLFAQSWQPNGPIAENIEEDDECYAVMPPLEQFMEVPGELRRELFFRDIERGDIVIGRITSIREFGFFMVLMCLGSGLIRQIADLEITDVDRYHEKITVSLYSSALPPNLSSITLGVITSDDLPLHYKRSIEVANSAETFEEVLHRSRGFDNPSLIEYLTEKLGISESNPPSLMRSLQIVKAGVDYFKVGRHVEAMNEYNKALEIDPQNVEALVARGALYATKGSLNKAISDFEIALENCPTHRNARKYLCQTLVERGGQLEEEDKLLNAESYYKKALSVDETFQEAEEALTKLRKHMQKSLEMREKQAAKEERQKEKRIETSAEKLRKLLKEEKRLKKKRKRSTSSSSSSSSSSSDSSSDVSISSSSSSSDHKKHKKKRRHRSESSRSSKKRSSRASSHYKDQVKKEEWYSPPADTSASFLNQSFEMEKLLERQDSLACPKTEVREKDRHCSLSRTSGDDEDTFGGRSEDSRDSYSSSRTQASSSKSEKYHKTDRFFSSRRGYSGSYYKSDDKMRTHYFRKSERDIEGRREHFKKHGSYQDRYYRSPSGSDYSGKSVGKYRSYSSTHFHEGDKSYGSDRHALSQHRSESGYKSREMCHEESNKTEEPDKETLNGAEQTESGIKRNLPQNLVNIFNQIAEFEREKGTKAL